MITTFYFAHCGENTFNYNSLNLEIPKNFIKKFMKIKKYKEIMIDKCIKILNERNRSNKKYNILTDYKMNNHTMSYEDEYWINVIFNPLNYEKLLSNGGEQFVLIDLNNFTHDINIVIKYFYSQLYVIVDPYYFIQGKIWINFHASPLSKYSFTEINKYSYSFFIYMNKLSIYLKYLYSIFQKYDYSMPKIKKDKEIQYLFKMFNIDTLFDN
jgi:hypothetical protein